MVFLGTDQQALAREAKDFSERYRRAWMPSATALKPIACAPGKVLQVTRAGCSPAPLSERELTAGVCHRCGSRLTFGCNHHPRSET